MEPGLAFGFEAGDPAVLALAGHTRRFRDVSDWHPSVDTFDEESASEEGETSVRREP